MTNSKRIFLVLSEDNEADYVWGVLPGRDIQKIGKLRNDLGSVQNVVPRWYSGADKEQTRVLLANCLMHLAKTDFLPKAKRPKIHLSCNYGKDRDIRQTAEWFGGLDPAR